MYYLNFPEQSPKQKAFLAKRHANRVAYEKRAASVRAKARLAASKAFGDEVALYPAPVDVSKDASKFVMNFPLPGNYWALAKADRPTQARATKRNGRWELAIWGTTAHEVYGLRVAFEAAMAAPACVEARPEVTGGRQLIEGTVASVKLVCGVYDDCEEARYTIDLDNGNRVYGKLHEEFRKGDRVRVSACLKLTGDDKHFGLLSRSKAV